eukprot:g2580.t1
MTKNNALLHILESKKHEADVNNKDDSVQEKKVGKVKTGNVDLTKKRMIQHLSEQENEKRKKTESNPEPTVIVINDDAEEDEPPKSTGNGRKGKKNFTRAQKVQILKHVVAVKNKLMVDGHEEGEALTRAYNFTAEHFKKELERETFTAMSIRNWTNPKRSHCKTIEEYITRLENLKKNLNAESKEIEGKILHVGRADRTAYEKNTQRTADYPEMEQMLFKWCDMMRVRGVCVYFTHLAIEGRFFLQWLAEKDPEKYKDWKSFKFSESWKEGFAKRFNISLQVPTRGKKAMDPDDEKKAIAVFHANTRALQLTEPRRCKIYGHILAVYVFNRDQVPVKLMSQTLRTVHKKNSGTVQVITGSSNAAREGSLDLKVPMELLVIDGKVVNFPKPTLVFHGTGHFKNKCMTTDTKILEEESKLWDPDVNVFFQKK